MKLSCVTDETRSGRNWMRGGKPRETITAYLGPGGLMAKKWIRFTGRIYYEVPVGDGGWEMRHAACPACSMDLGLTLDGEPGENPDVICPCGVRFLYPNRWVTWWEENLATDTFEPHSEVRRDGP
ncbi:hypothetical protein ACTVZO_40225 [Streptomyces sp. IBSNAI002]|uniref:hypothetical protein n=1 Tax=Streptomyces sp. IBSNAI002 TaxID=3457500 RepID=UPI003FD49D41